jgi:hypothetical protein
MHLEGSCLIAGDEIDYRPIVVSILFYSRHSAYRVFVRCDSFSHESKATEVKAMTGAHNIIPNRRAVSVIRRRGLASSFAARPGVLFRMRALLFLSWTLHIPGLTDRLHMSFSEGLISRVMQGIWIASPHRANRELAWIMIFLLNSTLNEWRKPSRGDSAPSLTTLATVP